MLANVWRRSRVVLVAGAPMSAIEFFSLQSGLSYFGEIWSFKPTAMKDCTGAGSGPA
jgi:hypothetical protein